MRIKLEGPLFKDKGIMKIIANSKNEMSIFEGPNFEYIFILGGENATAPAIAKNLKSSFRNIGHNHPVDKNTGFVQFMPSKSDLDVNEGRRLFIISPFGIIWYEVDKAAVHSNLFDVFRAKKGNKYFGEVLVRAAHTDFETIRAFYKLMMVDVSFEPRNGTTLAQDPAKSLFALAREEGFYRTPADGKDSIESLYSQVTKLFWRAQAVRDTAVSGRASSHIEKAPEDKSVGFRRRISKILINTWDSPNRNTKPYPEEVERRVTEAVDRLFFIYGPAVTNKIRAISIVPYLKGDSVSELRHGVIRIDEKVIETNSLELRTDVIEHEFWHMILEDIDDDHAIQEMVAIFQSLSRFRDPNYDVEEWMDGLVGEGAVSLRIEDVDAYQNNFLSALKKVSGVDPEGKAGRLYKETRDIFAKANPVREDVVGRAFENIAEYIFARGGYKYEKEAMRILHGGAPNRTASIDEFQRSRTDIIRRAKEALKKLDRKREQFMVERYLTEALGWKDIVRISSLLRTDEGENTIARELIKKADDVTAGLGFSDLSPEEKGDVVKVVTAEVLWRKLGFVRALAEHAESLKDSNKCKEGIRSLAMEYGLKDAEFESYKYMILLEMTYGALFKAVELVRDPKEGKNTRVVFEDGTARIGETAKLKLPAFLNELWELLDGCAIDVMPDAGEEEFQLFLEDLMEYARVDPIGAYLDIRGIEPKLPKSKFIVVEKGLLSVDDMRNIAKMNKGSERIFVIQGNKLDTKMILGLVQARNKAAKRENTIFVVSDLKKWPDLWGSSFRYFKSGPGVGLGKIVRLANGIMTGVAEENKILDMIQELDPAFYKEACEIGVVPILKKIDEQAAQNAKTKLASNGKLKIIPGAEVKGGGLTTKLGAQQVRVMP